MKYKDFKRFKRFWKRQYKKAFSEWRNKKRSLRKSAIKELCRDFSEEKFEKISAMECFDTYHNIGYLD